MASKVRTVRLADIVVDDAMQSRATLDVETIERYQADMEAGDDFPPLGVVSDGTAMYLYSGFHRFRAFANRKTARVPVEVIDGTRRDAILLAAGQNHGHGRPRTNADKRRAVTMLLADGEWTSKSDRWIAETARVSHEFVRSIRGDEKPDRVETKDGRTEPACKKHVAKSIQEVSTVDTSPDTQTVESLESLGNATPPAKLPPREPVEEQTAPPTADNWGHELPPHTVDAFASVGELKTICGLIGDVAKRLARWVSGPGGRHLSQGTIQQLEAAKSSAWAARPLYVCPYCHGDKSECQACKGDGWVTDRIWKAAPADKRGPF